MTVKVSSISVQGANQMPYVIAFNADSQEEIESYWDDFFKNADVRRYTATQYHRALEFATLYGMQHAMRGTLCQWMCPYFVASLSGNKLRVQVVRPKGRIDISEEEFAKISDAEQVLNDVMYTIQRMVVTQQE